MKLSIIVPVYNVEKYLRKCLDSLAEQTAEDYEVILVNDGSKDASREIAAEYAGKYPFFRIIDLDNGGQGRARNFGIDAAQGEYIGFVDSDDWAAPEMFSRLLDYAEREEADIAVCDYYRCEETGERLYEKARLQDHPLSAAGAVWNKLFRREIIGDVRFPVGLWYEDFEFSAKVMMKSSKTVFLHEPLYFYRSGHASTMRNANSSKNLDMLRIMESIREVVAPGREEDFRFLVINHVLLDSIKRVSAQNSKNKKAVIAKLREYVKKYVPDLENCESFRKETRNRRIIMWLNYNEFEFISDLILKIKK